MSSPAGPSTRPVALVTGASTGIGAALARALADRGHDLVLVARDRARLEALAAELPTAAEVLPADLQDEAQLAAVEARLADADRPVDVLVNNAGFGTSGRFDRLPLDKEDGQVRLNVLALVRLTHAALPGMVARRRGGVLQVASVGGFVPAPGNAVYGATKAFVLSFGEAVHEELRGTGVTVTVLAPGFTRTEFQERADYDTSRVPAFLWQTADQVARAGLDGLQAGKALVVPGALNAASASSTRLLPRAAARRVAGLLTRH